MFDWPEQIHTSPISRSSISTAESASDTVIRCFAKEASGVAMPARQRPLRTRTVTGSPHDGATVTSRLSEVPRNSTVLRCWSTMWSEKRAGTSTFPKAERASPSRAESRNRRFMAV